MTLPTGSDVSGKSPHLKRNCYVFTSSVLAAPAWVSAVGLFTVCRYVRVHAAEEMLRKAVGKGAYEMAVSQQENALWVATSQSRKTDKGGVVYRLDPVTLEVTQAIHNDLKPFGATIDNATQTLWFGNTVNSAVTAIDAKTSEVKGRPGAGRSQA